MAWTDLTARFAANKLPLVLAGPILRQVTKDSVTVWVALLRSANVTLTVYASDKDTGSGLMHASLKTTPIGVNLHVVAVTARATNALGEGAIYFYDMSFDTGEATLKDAVGYGMGCGTDARPSFALPPADLNKLRILHGSCRKPHGHGEDELVDLDGLIQGAASLPDKRPHLLLLNGDQIYADDVADSLLMMLTEAGEFLLDPPNGPHEVLPAVDTEGDHLAANLPPYSRDALLVAAGFTSDDRRSHLMTLGEFFAMYLFVWSEVLWPPSVPQPADVAGVVSSDAWAQLAYGANKKNIAGDVKALERFRLGVVAVRHALANIPCYMICDDHEVTDDWNMSHRFARDIYGSPLGLNIVTNALVAFSICQAWGNDPTQFADASQPGGLLLSILPAQKYQSSPDIRTIVGMHAAYALQNAGTPYRVFHETGTQSLNFNFVIEGTNHFIIVTDSRTWRAFPDSDLDSHAQLIATAQIPIQLSLPKPLTKDQILFLVLTTNLPPIASFRYATAHPKRVNFGEHWSESVVTMNKIVADKHGWSGGARAVYEEDLNDSWRFPSLQVDRVVAQVTKLFSSTAGSFLGQVVVLSGDVHFGFASRLAYWVEKQRLGDTSSGPTGGLVFAQFVSSALKNENDDTIGLHKAGYTYAPGWLASKFVPPNDPEGYGGWNWTQSSAKVVGFDGISPIFISEDTPTCETQLGSKVTLSDPPDYRYRLDFLTPVDRGQGWTSPTIPRANNTRDYASNYATASAALRQAQTSGVTLEQVIGHNNIGDITLSWDPDPAKRVVYQTLYWREPGARTKLYWRQYAVTLNLDDADFPKIKALNE